MNWIETILNHRILGKRTAGKCEQCGKSIYLCDTSGKLRTLCEPCEHTPKPEMLRDEGGFHV